MSSKEISKERADEINSAWLAANNVEKLLLPRLAWFVGGDGTTKYWELPPTELETHAAGRIAELEGAIAQIRKVLVQTKSTESAVGKMIVATCDSALRQSSGA